MSLLHDDARRDAFDFTSHFREDFYACLTRRGDALFELTDAMLCADGPVTSPVDLTLLAEHRRGHGALYDALNRGRIDVDGLRRALAGLPQPKAADGRLVLAVDVSQLAAAGRPDQRGPLVLPRLRPQRTLQRPGRSRAGRTRSSPRWRPAAPRGASCWTRSVSAPTTTSPRSPPPRSAGWSPGPDRRAGSGRQGDRGHPGRLRRRLRRPAHGLPPGRPARRGAGADACRTA